MPENGAYAFNEPIDYEASISEAKIELVVTGGGQFRATLTRAELGQLRLLRSREDLASVAYAGLQADLVFVTFPTRFNPPPVWSGQELRSGEIVVHGLGERVHLRTCGSSERGFIALRPEHLASWGRALTEVEVVPPNFARIVRPSGSAAKHLLRLHAAACGLVEDSPQIIAHPEVARALEQELIHALVSCLRPDAPLQTRPIRARRAAVMNRFEEVLAAHPDRPLHIPELCMAIGVSERTLRLCCAEFIGMNPGRYLRLRQLRLARRALMKPDSATTSVAAVARRYGFSELGRFASLYRAVYGETPSATLRLRRHRASPE
jgi:AraC-like DNA-binding protein